MRKQFATRAEYALTRMDAAFKRMNASILSENDWESALKWATAWGVAIQAPPRCVRVRTCSFRTDACWYGKSNRPALKNGTDKADA